MSWNIKNWLESKTTVTGAATGVFLLFGYVIVQQFDFYLPIPIENIFFIIVLGLIMLGSKSQDEALQKAQITKDGYVEPTSAFEGLLKDVREGIDNIIGLFVSRAKEPEPEAPKPTPIEESEVY